MSLTEMVIMPGADYVDACDAVREKTGGTATIKSGELGGLIRSISGGGGGGGSSEEWIGDGNTHIWISLTEGRTSPMLGVCPNGTVTVDWGDGSTPDVLTGTSTSTVVWTPTHNYAAAGDYVITLTVDGEMGFKGDSVSQSAGSYILRYSSNSDGRNNAYRNAVRKIEIGNNAILNNFSFNSCYGLTDVLVSDGVNSIGNSSFYDCFSLVSAKLPKNVTNIGVSVFNNCYNLTDVTIPDNVTTISQSMFTGCRLLTSITIPDGVTTINGNAFQHCYSLTSITIPDGVTTINAGVFERCYSLKKLRFNPTTPPAVSSSNAFSNIPTDCIISVPVGSLDAYKTATNYPDPATYTYIEED